MDVPLRLNDIGIRYGFMGFRKSSTISQKTDVRGVSCVLWASMVIVRGRNHY